MSKVREAINKEFANIFTNLAARVEVFQTTQKGFVDNFYDDIKSKLPMLTDSEVSVAASVYGICLTDDALKNYSIIQYSQDVSYLKSLLPDEEDAVEEKIEEVEEKPEEVLEEGELGYRPLPQKEEPKTLAQRVQTAVSTETKFMKVLAAYYQANSVIERAMNGFNNELILLNVNERPDLVITSLLIRNHLLPLYSKASGVYTSSGIEVDLRFITAQIKVSIERLLNPKLETKSQKELFEEIEKIYPLGNGDDLYWDLSEQILYHEYYPKLKELLQPQIDEGIREKIDSRSTMLAKMEQEKAQGKVARSKESIRSKVDSIIFESFHFNRPFNDDARLKMQRAVEAVLKRMALEEYGIQDILDLGRFKTYFIEEFFTPIFDEYVQLYLPFIDIREYRSFVNDPKTTVDKSRDYVNTQFWFAMRKHAKSDKLNASQLAHAFSMVMHEIMNDNRVKNFD